MQRYFLYFAYDGFRYHGWQIQPNGITVQECVEESLSLILREKISIVGAGRTDAGVHARVMVAHFDVDTVITNLDSFCDKLNRVLPSDIAAYKVVPVKNDAHSRFDAMSRTYHYYVIGSKSPFEERYAWRYHGSLDFEKMNRAASHLFDYTDFTSFSKLHTDVKTNNCRIMQARWEIMDNKAVFIIQADRFLRNMVRAIVGTLIDVGRGKISVIDFCHIIEQKNRCKAGVSMPGNALFLMDISYPDDIFMK